MARSTLFRAAFSGIFIFLPLTLTGQDESSADSIFQKREYFTSKITGQPPVIDGQLDDPAWDRVAWGNNFITYEPDEGKAPAQKTAFKILYDDRNVYIGIMCYDTNPSKIVKRLGRRDNVDGDYVAVVIDSYFDHLTAFEFDIAVTGVFGDAYTTNNGENTDYSWDPIWFVKTNINNDGWVAEIRIPLSQLRFPQKEELTWGFEILRNDFRKGELSLWQPIPKKSNGYVYLMGELHGLQGLKQQKQLEIMPYVLGKVEKSRKEEGNPYATGSKKTVNGGLDAKIGLTSNFTLDLTVNPDFGQVEADPSVVNLTGFQNYFSERRPFFVESNNILDYRVSESIAWGNFNSDNLFYSRRIGHSPQGSPDYGDNEYLYSPDYTTILGAMKLTGKTQKGLSVGILESVTRKERAKISDGTHERKAVVEPLTNYFESRVIQDYNQGNTQVGGIFTAVNRDIQNPEVEFLRRSAYTGGVDFIHNWHKKTWYVSGNMIFSQVNGSREAILETQTSQEHLFQRPGSGPVKVDSTMTTMNGTGATLKFGKGGNGNIQFQVGGTYKSPSLELNDIGYLYKANAFYQFAWASYHLFNPWWILNNFQGNVNQWTYWDFGGNNLYRAANYNMNMQFKNYYGFGSGVTYTFYKLDNDMLRGGPAFRLPGNAQMNFWVGSDYRKKITTELNYSTTFGSDNYLRQNDYYITIRYQPVSYFSFSLNPGISINKNKLQYIANIEDPENPRYIIGNLNQYTASLTARININITPNLTIQYYGSPFVSKGTYNDFKNITDPKAALLQDRFVQFTPGQVIFNGEENKYSIDENNDGSTDFSFDNPDFDYVQFNSNMVVRWEYKPGSTLFLVWTQARTGSDLLQDHSFGNLTGRLFDIYPGNVFLIKLSYRFIR